MATLRDAFRRRRQLDPEAERELDRWVRDALLEDTLAQPSSGAWDRLRRAVSEYERHHHGMWVLEQPLHDPRETAPVRREGRGSTGTISLYELRIPYHRWQVGEAMWGTMLPTFSPLLNF